MALPRVLVLLGSGEIAPGLAPVHRRIFDRIPATPAVVLDTPYGFQENADELTEKIQTYFSERCHRVVELATLRNTAAASDRERAAFAAKVEAAGYVFSGPGSPSYALAQWRNTEFGALMQSKLRDGGVVVFASAASITVGIAALPVYEIYKVGAEPHWLEGLDLLSAVGVKAAVIPHFDNHEGGTHDTRFCFLGERRFRQLEAQLEADTTIVGIDEHTAVIMDFDKGSVEVAGRGSLTIRHQGEEQTVKHGSTIALRELQPAGSRRVTPPAAAASVRQDDNAALARTAFDNGDIDAAIDAMLRIESDGAGAADRPQLRRLIARLGDAASRAGAADPRAHVQPLVEGVLELRRAARVRGDYALSDELRDLLIAAGVEVHDTAAGVSWNLKDA